MIFSFPYSLCICLVYLIISYWKLAKLQGKSLTAVGKGVRQLRF